MAVSPAPDTIALYDLRTLRVTRKFTVWSAGQLAALTRQAGGPVIGDIWTSRGVPTAAASPSAGTRRQPSSWIRPRAGGSAG